MIPEEDLKVVVAKEEYQKGKEQLKHFENKNQFPLKKWISVAAVLIVISVFSFWFLNQQKETPKDLYGTHFSPYTNVVAPISRNDDELSFKEIAFLNYEEKKYNNALSNFNELLQNASSEEKKVINLYKAICLLALEKPEQAVAILQNYKTVNDKFKDKYLWYLGLAYLQKNDAENAQKTFEILAKETYNFKQKETLSILKSLQ